MQLDLSDFDSTEQGVKNELKLNALAQFVIGKMARIAGINERLFGLISIEPGQPFHQFGSARK